VDPIRRACTGVLCLAAVAIAAPLSHAQKASGALRIAALDGAEEAGQRLFWQAFYRRLGELGYVQGSTMTAEHRWGNADPARLPLLASELVAKKPDIIVTVQTTAALAAKRATSTIPIVAIEVADPTSTGLAASLARPDANVTGFTTVPTVMTGKWLELLRAVAPKARTVALLTDTGNAGARVLAGELQQQARALGIDVRPMNATSAADVELSFDRISRARMDAFIVSATTVILAHRERIVRLANEHRIPAIYGRHEYTRFGGLLSYGTDTEPLFVRAAEYVARIAAGAKPSDLPFERAASFRLVVNLTTAKALNIQVPAAVLARADEVLN
jgi:putative tryptophan/tyrosine transport system substrate-binding protein